MNRIIEVMEAVKIDNVKTGRNARALRESKSVSLRRVATAMLISAPYLSGLELGTSNWTEGLADLFTDAVEGMTNG